MTRVPDHDARWPSALAYARLDADDVETWRSTQTHRQREGYKA